VLAGPFHSLAVGAGTGLLRDAPIPGRVCSATGLQGVLSDAEDAGDRGCGEGAREGGRDGRLRRSWCRNQPALRRAEAARLDPHFLARHVEGASHMADGYSRAAPGNIGVCIGTSGPAGTDMITGLYTAQADSIPILCITGQAPRAKLHKEDFQAVDIESIAKPVTKWAVTVREPGLVPRVFQQAFHRHALGPPRVRS
jgi:hypothetical protein